MNEHDPILEAALEEALGGKGPPDLIAQTLAKAGADAVASPKQSVAGPRPAWRAWGPGLAAAAVVMIVGGLAFGVKLGFGGDGILSNGVTQASKAPAGNQAGGARGSVDYLFDSELKERAGGDTHGPKESKDTSLSPVKTVYFATPAEEPKQPPPKPDNQFEALASNPFVDTEDDRLSTFALEHDTGSYAIVRKYLSDGNLPPKAAVRVEEFVNYFDYGYVKPALDPFSITMDAAPSRYGQNLKNSYLLRVGVQARDILPANRKPAILTFVIDVSGSMKGSERLGLVKRALNLLVNELQEGDLVGIAVYGNTGEMYMDYKDASRKSEIIAAIDSLDTKGSTNAEEGLKVAYRMASGAYRDGYTNRVILCSDGVANVGKTQADGILNTIIENRRRGITLSTVGFGMGNYNDTLMEQLGDKGDGHYAYVDSIDEAKRIFVDNLTGALEVVGRDVKIQIEFNPKVVKSYRLLGYVNRDIKDEDFRNDSVDGGEIGAGHAATALYEIKLHEGMTGAMAYATLRYREDEQDDPVEVSREVFTSEIAQSWEFADKGLRLAGNVAEFAEILGESFYAKGSKLEEVTEDLEAIKYEFRDEKVDELRKLVATAQELK
ncbi:MAG: von Willebrand factor type A domain-containing protein [Planctomycetes bacterium]|nr:von Willebrand factor type A domain-containing protein [Planctomycetota bacterium]